MIRLTPTRRAPRPPSRWTRWLEESPPIVVTITFGSWKRSYRRWV